MTDAAASITGFRMCDKTTYWICFSDKFVSETWHWSVIAFCCSSSSLILPYYSYTTCFFKAGTE